MNIPFPTSETRTNQNRIYATMKQEEDVYTRDLVEEFEACGGNPSQHTTKPTFVAPDGTWKDDTPSDAELLDALEKTATAAARDGLPFRRYFQLAAESLKAKLQSADRRGLWRRELGMLPVSQGEIGSFANACMAALAFDSPMIRVKMRRKRDDVQVGVYVPGVGSLIARAYGKRPASLEFSPGMESFFLPSYRDGMPCRYVPEAVWDGKIGAQALCESGAKTPTLKPFTVDGTLYITTGGMFSGELAECDAWAVIPLEEWAGETYNYDEVRAHWDAGSLERGDKRGLVVNVRRKPVVLTSFANFYDDRRS